MGNDVLRGQAGDESDAGDPTDTVMFGDEGNDKLYGGTGDDGMAGEEGADEHYGGPVMTLSTRSILIRRTLRIW